MDDHMDTGLALLDALEVVRMFMYTADGEAAREAAVKAAADLVELRGGDQAARALGFVAAKIASVLGGAIATEADPTDAAAHRAEAENVLDAIALSFGRQAVEDDEES